MRGYFTYIIKTWLATMVIAPIVFASLFYLFDPTTSTEYPFLKMVTFLIFVGFVFSIPSLLLLGLASRYFEKIFDDTRGLKTVTILVSMVLIIISFIFFFNGMEKKELPPIIGLAITYIISILGFGFYFKIKSPKHPRSSF